VPLQLVKVGRQFSIIFLVSREAKQLGGTRDASPLSNVAQPRLPLATDASLSSNFAHHYQLQ
ncbi:jg24923, partial [Pararge aegeria aegeria]